jgi:hypothetical protein
MTYTIWRKPWTLPMDQDLKDYLDQMGRRLSGLEDTAQQTQVRLHDEIQMTRILLYDEIQQTRILLERQHDDIRQVAEGVVGTNERLDSFRDEVAHQFDEVRSLISPPYRDLDSRVKILESWKERTDRDPVEIVRERFGRPKT